MKKIFYKKITSITLFETKFFYQHQKIPAAKLPRFENQKQPKLFGYQKNNAFISKKFAFISKCKYINII